MMKTLVSSSSRVSAAKLREKWLPSPMDPQIRFFRPKLRDVGFLGLISVHRKLISPISSSSSGSQAKLDAAGIEVQGKPQTPTVHVRLQLQKQCAFGEEFLVVGDDPMFGLWDPSSAVPMCWSDGHVWIAELDMPAGKLIQFKFILKGIDGTILWQPGPDRILRTWATENIITVIEEWEDAELQKITEGPVSLPIEDPVVFSDVLQDVNHTKDILISDHPSEKPPAKAEKKINVAQDIPQPQEKPMAMVAENITHSQKDPLAESHEVLQTETMTIKNLGMADREKIHEGGPVLVPGLTPVSTVATKETREDWNKRSISMDASAGAMEAKKDLTLPELDDKQEPEDEPHHEDTTEMACNDENEEEQDAELERKSLARKEKQKDSNSTGNGFFFRNDMQWGGRTLQNAKRKTQTTSPCCTLSINLTRIGNLTPKIRNNEG